MSEELYYQGEASLKNYAENVEAGPEINSSQRNSASASWINSIAPYGGDRTFVNHSTDISVRSDYNRYDYNYFRPSDSVYRDCKGLMSMCMLAYDRVGIVRNIIDLMSDFSTQGIRLQHPNKKYEAFYNKWFELVKGKERSERFLNYLYRCGNVITRRDYAKVPARVEKEWNRGRGQEEDLGEIKTTKRNIPIRYHFLNPLMVDIIGGEMSIFTGKVRFGVNLSYTIRNDINRLYNNNNQILTYDMNKVPVETKNAVKLGQRLIPLEEDRTDAYYYKKDDWSLWAKPLISPIISDLIMYEKMKLADISALDGAISNIRLWRLGVIGPTPQESILPTKTMLNKLRNILANNVGGGVLDLVWGPELDFKESASQVWRFLGSDKYITTLDAIYDGLGIPQTLRSGGSGGRRSGTGNAIGVQTLLERLEYGRDVLESFWNKELKIVHQAMDFTGKPPSVVYDYPSLTDKIAEKQLLLDLWDRDVISTESIQEIFGRIPDVENARIGREMERRGDQMPEKASPYHNPEKEHDYKKLLLQSGMITPSELGLELDEKKDGEETMLDKTQKTQVEMKQMDVDNQMKITKERVKQQRVGVSGRPRNVVETRKRQPKTTTQRSNSDFITKFVWALDTQNKISELVNPAILHAYGKDNLRKLTNEEYNMLEYIKFGIICNINPFDDITQEKMLACLSTDAKPTSEAISIYHNLKSELMLIKNRELRSDEIKQLYAATYAECF